MMMMIGTRNQKCDSWIRSLYRLVHGVGEQASHLEDARARSGPEIQQGALI